MPTVADISLLQSAWTQLAVLGIFIVVVLYALWSMERRINRVMDHYQARNDQCEEDKRHCMEVVLRAEERSVAHANEMLQRLEQLHTNTLAQFREMSERWERLTREHDQVMRENTEVLASCKEARDSLRRRSQR